MQHFSTTMARMQFSKVRLRTTNKIDSRCFWINGSMNGRLFTAQIALKELAVIECCWYATEICVTKWAGRIMKKKLQKGFLSVVFSAEDDSHLETRISLHNYKQINCDFFVNLWEVLNYSGIWNNGILWFFSLDGDKLI